MKKIMNFLGQVILLFPCVCVEFLVKLVWCIVFCIFKPIWKQFSWYYDAEDYAFTYSYYALCAKLYKLWS